MWQDRASNVALVVVLVFLIAGLGVVTGLADESPIEDSKTSSKQVAFHLGVSQLRLLRVGEHDYVSIEGTRPFTSPGEPLLPAKTIVSEFEKNTEILGVSVIHETQVQMAGLFNIAPTPQPLLWHELEISEYVKDPRIYSLDHPFPGGAFSYRIGEDTESRYVYIHVYPIQYVPLRGEVSIITDLVLEIRFRSLPGDEPKADEMTAECIIITPPELYAEAKDLSDFHENTLGIPTAVVNTTWISANYPEAPDPPFPGYWDNTLNGWEQIVGYDYGLAKKTIGYLDNVSAHPLLDYVVLYGNAELVPPSFYWYDDMIGGFFPFEGWVPTDFFYSSPEYDFTPNYAIGRLSVDDVTKAQNLNQKIKNWHSNLSADWYQEVVVAGGKPFQSDFYVGEMITVDSINKKYFDGFNITKLYLTDGKFDRTNVLQALSGGYGLIYEIGHGMGDTLVVNDADFPGEFITVFDVLSLPQSSQVPVFVSIACDNGGYDGTLMMNKPYMSDVSFGEALLHSPAGSIAYVGGSRMNSGVPQALLEEGELNITDETGMAFMLTSFWKVLYEGEDKLGNVSKGATAHFTTFQNMTDPQNIRTLLEYVLLGDPVLPLSHPRLDRYQVPEMDVSFVSRYDSYGSPGLAEGEIAVIPMGYPNPVITYTDSPTVDFKLIDVVANLTLDYASGTTTNNQTEYLFTPLVDSRFLFRAEGEDGKEGWQYMKSEEGAVPPSPEPPVLVSVELIGAIDDDVEITWLKSTDEGQANGTSKYEVYQSDAIGGPYVEIIEIVASNQSSYRFLDVGMGHGDPSNYFYYVCSVNVFNMSSCSTDKGGKFTMALSTGEHLVSVPLVLSNESLKSVLRTVDYDKVWAHDAVSGEWMWVMKDKTYTRKLVSLDRRMGFWVEVISPSYFTVAGLVPSSTAIQLQPGWNLVGFPSFNETLTVSYLYGAIGATRVEAYDQVSAPYYLRILGSDDTLSAGHGYWIKVNTAIPWVVSGT